jgi:hypothetical protein
VEQRALGLASRIADLVRAGKVRVALFLPQYAKNPVTGERRVAVHLMETARALARRLGGRLFASSV